MVIIEVFQDTELFESVELYWADGLEMAGILVTTLWKRLLSHC